MCSVWDKANATRAPGPSAARGHNRAAWRATARAAFGVLAITITTVPQGARAQEGQWSPVGGGVVGPLAGGKGTVRALSVHEDRLVVGGLLARAGGTEIGNVAAWDGEVWDDLGGGTDKPVDALAVYDGALIAGGSFVAAGGTAASRVARHADDRWTSLGAGLGGWVTSLFVEGDRLIAGGQFLTAGGDSARRVAVWDGTSWAPLGSGLGAGASRRQRGRLAREEVVYALGSFRGGLIAGGVFLQTGGREVANIARWDGAEWCPLGDGLDGEVHALAEYRGRLIAGGTFTEAGDETVNHIAAWDGTRWHPLASRLSLEPGVARWVYALDTEEDALLVGGCFLFVGSEEAEFIARWNGTAWRPVMTGLDHCVKAFARFRGAIYVGGDFDRAGLRGTRFLARWEP